MKEPKKEEYLEEFDVHWKPKLYDEYGYLDMNQLAKNLYDFNTLYQSVANVYYFITGGQISDPFTEADQVIFLFSEIICNLEKNIKKGLAEDLAMHFLQKPKTDYEKGQNDVLKDITSFLLEDNIIKEQKDD